MKLITKVLWCLLIILQFLFAQENWNTTLIGRWAEGTCNAVDFKGDTACFNNGSYLILAEIKDPSNPTELGRILLPNMIEDIVVKDNYAYVTNREAGLRILDISDPANIIPKGYYDNCGFFEGLAVSGDFAYVTDRNYGFYIYDISGKSNPIETGFINVEFWPLFENDYYHSIDIYPSMAVSDDHAYVPARDSIHIINISDTVNPIKVGSLPYSTEHIAFSNGYAYILRGNNLCVLNITDPEVPFEEGRYAFPSTYTWLNKIVVKGEYAYVSDPWNDELYIVNISDPSNPTEIARTGLSSRPNELAVFDENLYLAESTGLHIYNITDPTNPDKNGTFLTPGNAEYIAIDGDVAYSVHSKIHSRHSNCFAIDISDPSKPKKSWEYSFDALSIAIKGMYAYVGQSGRLGYNNETGGLHVYDITDPENPIQIGYFRTGISEDYTYPSVIKIVGNYAYVVEDYGDFFDVIDISDPATPNRIGQLESIDGISDLTIEGNFAYANYEHGFSILNLSNPAIPHGAGQFDLDQVRVYTLAVQGDHVFLLDDEYGLRVIDVSNKFDPTEVGHLDISGGKMDIVINGKYAYVSHGWDGISVIDISNLENPVRVGFFHTGDFAHQIAVIDEYICVADGDDGIYIISNDLVSGISSDIDLQVLKMFSLDQNFPNPFNTTTAIGYQLSAVSDIELSIYNLVGQKVAKLVSEKQNAGYHQIEWDASGFSSGVYYYRIKAGEYQDVKKMILLK